MNTEDDEFERIEREATRGIPDAIHHTDTSESLEYIQGWNDCRQAMLAEQPAPVQEPDELIHIGEQDFLGDVNAEAWRSLIENRGGCICFISPPCGACSNPISEQEMNEVGYTYTAPQAQRKPLTEPEFEALHCKAKGYVQTGLMDVVRLVEAAHGIKEKNT